MKVTFEDFWNNLVSDDIWYDRIKYQYSNKDIKGIAQDCYIDLLAQSTRWQSQDYTDFRRCFQKWLMNSKAAPVKPQLQQQTTVQEEVSSVPIVEGEERQKYIKEWLESVKNVKQQASLVPRLTKKQIADEGDWLPPKPAPYPSTSLEEIKKSYIHTLWIRHNYEPRTAEKMPYWMEEKEWYEHNKEEIDNWLKTVIPIKGICT